MTSSERIKLAIAGRESDRVPILMITRDFSIYGAGLQLGECLANPVKYVEAELRTLEKYGCDGVWDLHIAMPLLNELYGARLTVPKGLDGMDQPAHAEPVLKELKDLGKLTRIKVEDHPCMEPVRFVVSELKKAVGREVPVFGWAPPPFRTACMYRGVSNIMMDLIDEPGYVLDLMEICLEQSIAYSKILIDSGADYIFISNPTASSTVISRQHYEKYVHPFTKRMCSAIASMERKVLYHICGKWNDRLDLLGEEGVAIFHVDKINITEAKEKLKKSCIMGNVKTVDSLLNGTTELVQQETLKCIKDGAAGGRFILSADCLIPPKVPHENFLALVETGKSKGLYPISNL